MVVGDTVKISKNSQYYSENSPTNPRDMLGEIKLRKYSRIYVKWKNGKINSYYEHDLELFNSLKIHELWI